MNYNRFEIMFRNGKVEALVKIKLGPKKYSRQNKLAENEINEEITTKRNSDSIKRSNIKIPRYSVQHKNLNQKSTNIQNPESDFLRSNSKNSHRTSILSNPDDLTIIKFDNLFQKDQKNKIPYVNIYANEQNAQNQIKLQLFKNDNAYSSQKVDPKLIKLQKYESHDLYKLKLKNEEIIQKETLNADLSKQKIVTNSFKTNVLIEKTTKKTKNVVISKMNTTSQNLKLKNVYQIKRKNPQMINKISLEKEKIQKSENNKEEEKISKNSFEFIDKSSPKLTVQITKSQPISEIKSKTSDEKTNSINQIDHESEKNEIFTEKNNTSVLKINKLVFNDIKLEEKDKKYKIEEKQTKSESSMAKSETRTKLSNTVSESKTGLILNNKENKHLFSQTIRSFSLEQNSSKVPFNKSDFEGEVLKLNAKSTFEKLKTSPIMTSDKSDNMILKTGETFKQLTDKSIKIDNKKALQSCLPIKTTGLWTSKYQGLENTKLVENKVKATSSEINKTRTDKNQENHEFFAKEIGFDRKNSTGNMKTHSKNIQDDKIANFLRKSPVHQKNTPDQTRKITYEEKEIRRELIESYHGQMSKSQSEQKSEENVKKSKIDSFLKVSTNSLKTSEKYFSMSSSIVSTKSNASLSIDDKKLSLVKEKISEKNSDFSPIKSSSSVKNQSDSQKRALFCSSFGIAKEIPQIQSPILFINWLNSTKKNIPEIDRPSLSLKIGRTITGVGYNTHKGLVRNYNEDEIDVSIGSELLTNPNVKNFLNEPLHTFSIFSIFDGHGGQDCSKYLKNYLHNRLLNEAFHHKSEFANQVRLVFIKSELGYIQHSLDNNLRFSGSCALSLIVVNDLLISINLGDSRCILSMHEGLNVKEMTNDHKPECKEEFNRIIQAGGKVYRNLYSLYEKVLSDEIPVCFDHIQHFEMLTKHRSDIIPGPWRIFPGSLSVSRSFGDFSSKLKKLGGLSQTVINEPELNEVPIKNVDFAILGCYLIRRRNLR